MWGRAWQTNDIGTHWAHRGPIGGGFGVGDVSDEWPDRGSERKGDLSTAAAMAGAGTCVHARGRVRPPFINGERVDGG
jgi:hypothetical protein